jgi:formylglycine-generating enzyme required for sulfatase activity
LAYTRNDILEFREALLSSGFDDEHIVVMHDDVSKLKNIRYVPNADQIRKELALLTGTLESDDSLIVALAGHGVQFQGEAKSYFCPADSDLDDAERKRLIALSDVYDQLEQCRARKKLLLVDACRNDPQSQLSRSRASVDLESVTRPQAEPVPEGILALFSCSAGQQSYEYPDVKHGIFFHHVLEAWKGGADDGDKELTLDELVAFTRKRTQTFARLNLATIQTPEMKGSFSGTWVLRRLQQSELMTNSIGMKLRLIRAGEFLMGSPASEKERKENEFQHRVRITKPFYLGIHEVTVGNFRQFVAEEKYVTEAERGPGGTAFIAAKMNFAGFDPVYNWRNNGMPQTDAHPVGNISWNDATAFCEWLTRKEGRRYRLPTEAEWEYACRAGAHTAFQTGEDPAGLAAVANVADLTLAAKFSLWEAAAIPARDGFALTAPVGSLQPNAFGVFDMHGNVWEWCQDWHDDEYYRKSAEADPLGPVAGVSRIQRGGAWNDRSPVCRSAYRSWVGPSTCQNHFGFRVAAVP